MIKRVEIITVRDLCWRPSVSTVNVASLLTFQWPAGEVQKEQRRQKEKHVLPREMLRRTITIKQSETGRHAERRTRKTVRGITVSFIKGGRVHRGLYLLI